MVETSLTFVGVVWAALSMTSAVAACVGFYFPYWIQVPSTVYLFTVFSDI
jgi:hypothetical protein